jgi:aspartyl-tRNA(Asn)/glutamyl-tRNA(Gln) amidotransferase subunit B
LTELLKEMALGKPNDGPPLEQWVEEVIASMPAKVKEYRSGKKGLLALFMGELMKKTGGRVQPSAASEMLRSKLEG